jgi:hypothetical protein
MPNRSTLALIGVLLATTASPAFANGMGGIFQSLIFAAAAFGVIGGMLTGAFDIHPGAGILTSLASLFVAGMLYLLFGPESLSPSELIAGIFFTLMLIAFAGAIPLALVFFATYFATAIVRERIFRKKETSDTAP